MNPTPPLVRTSQTDKFFLVSPNVGLMHKIKIRSSGTGLGAPWHLARVMVTSSATGETLPFPYNNWIDKEHGLEQVGGDVLRGDPLAGQQSPGCPEDSGELVCCASLGL